MSDDPRYDPLPDDVLQRIKRFARDLAWGALYEKWGVEFRIEGSESLITVLSFPQTANDFRNYIEVVWKRNCPSLELLAVMDYLDESENGYAVTQKSFNLLDQPLPTKVFISYMHAQSSALALLIRYRLQAINPATDIFMDYIGLTHGTVEGWRSRLETAVRKSEWVICLTTNDSIKSETIRDEIQWALEDEKRRIIPVWHNGFIRPSNVSEAWLEKFLNIQAIPVKTEDAASYDIAVDELLSYFR